MKKIITVILIITLGVTAVSAFGSRKSKHNAHYSMPQGMDISTLTLPDGTFQGVATGFSPELTVEITIKKGVLTSIEVVSHHEVGAKYYSTPIKYIPSFIVKKQQTEVDAVSGATATSNAIMAATENAIKVALGEDTL